MPQVGETVTLSWKLPSQDGSKYMKAVVRTAAGALVAGSPFLMAHIGEGQYLNATDLVMPAAAITASYLIYDDALFTTPAREYGDGSERFDVTVPDSVILDILEQIQDDIQVLVGKSGKINIDGIISKIADIKGIITRQNITASFSQADVEGGTEQSNVTKKVESPKITAKVGCP